MSKLEKRVEELEQEVAFLRGQLAKARKFAQQIASLGDQEGEGGSEPSSPRSPRGVSFDGKTPSQSGSGSPRGKPSERKSFAALKSDASQWEMYVEPTTGDPYWFNRVLKVTVWSKPDCLNEDEEDGESKGGSDAHSGSVDEPKPKPHARLRSSSFAVRERAEEEHDASQWEEKEDEDGTPMWVHKTLKTATYKKPSILSGRETPTKPAHTDKPSNGHAARGRGRGHDEESTSALSESSSDSEAGEWAKYYGKKTGEPYWQNKATKQIVWTNPNPEADDEAESVQSGYQQDDGYDQEAAKPSNWKRMLDKSSGDYYYVFLPTKGTQWEIPACLL